MLLGANRGSSFLFNVDGFAMLLVNPVLQFDLPTDVILVKMFKTVLLVISVKLCVLIRSTLLPIILFTLLL